MSKVLGVRLDKETLKLLEEKASKEGKNKSKILKELIANYLAGRSPGGETKQNATKNDAFVEKKPVNANYGHDQSHVKSVKINQSKPAMAKGDAKRHFQPERGGDELKLDKVEQLTQEDAHFSQKHGENQPKANLFKAFMAIGLLFGLAAIGYFVYKAYVNRPKEEQSRMAEEPDYGLSPQALSYISR